MNRKRGALQQEWVAIYLMSLSLIDSEVVTWLQGTKANLQSRAVLAYHRGGFSSGDWGHKGSGLAN